jgi:photosystem II stability/assembly factor-like uncharacterized protein
VPDPDFGGLRTAVEDAAARAPFESLRARAAARRRRRVGLAAAGVAALTALVVVTVPRTSPGPPAEPVPTSTPPTESAGRQLVVDTAFGRTTTYALIGECTPADVCSYQLLSSTDSGRTWVRLPSPLGPLPSGDGFSAELRVTGDDDLAVLDPASGRLHVSTDRGRTFATRVRRSGPPLDAVPPGLRAETTYCGGDGCAPARVVVLDPATGLESALRAQPIARSKHNDLTTGADGRIWAAGRDGDRLVSAVSDDRGRSWRQLAPLGGPPARLYRLVPVPGGGAYLVTGREDARDVLNAFSDLWRLDGARWVRVTPAGIPRSALTAVGLADGELLLTEEDGGTWRTSGRGTRIARAPDPVVDGGPLPVAVLERSGGLIVGETGVADGRGPYVLVSADEGRTWDRRTIVPR